MRPEKIQIEDFEKHFPQLIQKGSIEINEGWFDLLWDMCEQLIAARNSQGILISDLNPLYFTQIKQKFGVLRVYACTSTREDEQIIEMFEDMSQFVCEVCGDAGSIRGKHWLYTACDAHTN